MTGTLVNVGAIVAGSLIGLLLKKGIPQHINDAILKAEGIAILVIGLNGVLTAMLTADATGRLNDSGGLLLLISLVGGCLVGELLRIDDHINSFGAFVERRSGASNFARGFVTASLIFSIGAMTVVGALNDGLYGDSTVLYIKSTLDFTTSIVLTAALGGGVLFAAVPVLVLQGSITLLAGFLRPFISDDLLGIFTMVGYAMVMLIGFNFLCGTKVKVANFLPSLLIPIAYHFFLLS